jgi:YYY domain-containing protein
MRRPRLSAGTAGRELALVVLILLVGATLRLTGVDWDQGQHLHPDERFLTMVATSVSAPGSIGEYLDTATSPANPANVGHPFFVYGTFPLFLTKAVAAALGLDSYARLHLVGRVLSALFDCGTILLTWLLGRLLAGPKVGLAAAALIAVSVPSIQHAHFFTVDSFATFFAAGALYGLLRVARGGPARDHVLFAVAFGLALACRVNLVLLAPLYVLGAARAVWSGRRPALETLGRVALATGAAALVFRMANPYAFTGPGLFDVSLAPSFLASLGQVRDMVAGNVHFPPALQWVGRLPVLFAARNVLLWNLGPIWGVAALAGMAWLLGRRSPAGTEVEREAWPLGRMVLLWTAALFLFHSLQFSATARYFLPLLPGLALFAVWPLAHGRSGRRSDVALALVLGATGLWALAFTSVYRQDHTRVQASRWIHEHLPPGATVAVEHWDDALPLPLEGGQRGRYRQVTLPVYDEDTAEKRKTLIEALDESDSVILSSNRAYGSIPRSPWRYPLTRRYYELLLAEELGFRLERVFTSHPRLGPLEIVDDDAEEAFSVYDHPKVLVFGKEPGFSRERVATLLGAVPLDGIRQVTPRQASALYRSTWPTSLSAPHPPRARSRAPTGSLGAAVRWLGGLELSALATFCLLCPLLGVARDRGYALSKILGWLAPGYLLFVSCSLGLTASTPEAARGAAFLLWTAGALAAWRHRRLLRQFLRERRGEWMTVQAVFWSGFGLFALLRALNPAVFWGEKPMDFAILNALYRSRTLPPMDPWFAGEPLRYFYFGHWLPATLGRITGVPPAFAFNLGIATLGALLASAALAAGRQMGGRRAGLLAAGGTVLLGNLAGVRLALADPGRALGFDFFWATSRVIPGTINEYPFWSLLFGDLHAHLLALPFDLALVGVASLWVTGIGAAGSRSRLVVAVLAAWVAGASVASSPWNLPVAMVVPAAFLATAWLRGRRTPRSLATTIGLGAGTWLLGGLLFLPLHARLRRTDLPSLGWPDQAASIADVWTIFGLFLLVILPALLIPVRWRPSARAVAVLALGALAVGGTAWLRSTSAAFFLGTALLAATVWRRGRTISVQAASLLVALAAGIGLMTETVFVSDRMNTVFKYSLHVWLMLAIAAGVFLSRTLRLASPALRPLWKDLAAVAVVCGLFTSAGATIGLVRDPPMRSPVPTLDGMRYLRHARPSEAEAFEWLDREVPGAPTLLEAQGPPYQLYSRVSMNSGLPTVLGWEHHLRQQGRPAAQIETRRRDVRTLFDTTDREEARALLDRYGVEYVFLGPLERQIYSEAGLSKFEDWKGTEVVFRNRDVTIHARPGVLESTRAWRPSLP